MGFDAAVPAEDRDQTWLDHWRAVVQRSGLHPLGGLMCRWLRLLRVAAAESSCPRAASCLHISSVHTSSVHISSVHISSVHTSSVHISSVTAAGVGPVCSYSALDGVPMCGNRRMLTDTLRTEWGHRGWGKS